MSIAALDNDLKLLVPSLMLEAGISRAEVLTAVQRRQKSGLFCPHCYQKTGKRFEVRYRNSESRRVHFYHSNLDGHECEHYSTESEKHLSAKAKIRDRLLLDESVAEVHLEFFLEMEGQAGWKTRKPDVLVIRPNGTREAHEVQISPISPEDLESRTCDLKQVCDRIVWYLHGKAYNETNRLKCSNLNADCYHLWFEDSDAERPMWKLSPPVASTPSLPNKRSGETGCSFSGQGNEVYPWGKMPKVRRSTVPGAAFSIGDRVTNKSNWHGIVTKIDKKDNQFAGGDGFYYWVYWHERTETPLLAKKPEVGHLVAELTLLVAEVKNG